MKIPLSFVAEKIAHFEDSTRTINIKTCSNVVTNQDPSSRVRNLIRQFNSQPEQSIGKRIKNIKVGAEFSNSFTKTKQEKYAANLIGDTFKAYKQRKKVKSENELGIKTLTNSNACRSYFYDQKGLFLSRTPDNFQKGRKGGFKQLIRSDEKFVQLHVHRLDEGLNQRSYNQLANYTLRDYESICKAQYVNPTTMIARNGGREVASLIEEGKSVKLLAFKTLLSDLKNLHDQSIYFHDIKPENLTFNDKIVRHIDVDNLIAPGYNTTDEGVVCSPYYVTQSLLNDIMHGDKKEQASRSHDNYAVLKSMIEATTGSYFDMNNRDEEDAPMPIFGMGNEALKCAKVWIDENVLSEWRDNAKQLLKFPGSQTESVAVFDMIDWASLEKNDLAL
ncbi:hypothetical protein CCZ37_17820 [Vibrio qinghaiensis]|uniref:Protein kinase domain-containing protein n=1 Tax=Vibrio qinghaiensis TaxID=2025808 RepID=A0A223N399_9VIBR|nr:hypothetical protein [Vibrio qinghaiensis]ASU24305.1 hypothetical protein CCZ37_17820 [Vibrio qinghaiensis]